MRLDFFEWSNGNTLWFQMRTKRGHPHVWHFKPGRLKTFCMKKLLPGQPIKMIGMEYENMKYSYENCTGKQLEMPAWPIT